MKYVLATLALLSLAACDVAPPGKGSAPAAGQSGNVLLGSTQSLPDWLLIAHQRDCATQDCVGDVYFDQRSITRSANGTADIWVQTQHHVPQNYIVESGQTVTTIQFTRERTHYRFKCAEEQFTVLERQILGPHDVQVAHDEYQEIYRAPAEGSAVPLILPIACRGS